MIQEDFWPQAQAARANKDRNSQREGCFLPSSFSCLTLPSVTKHTTLIFCSRDICYFSVEALLSALQHPQIAKKSKDQQKAPTLPPVRRRTVRVSVYLALSRTPSAFARSSDCFSAAMKFFESQHEFDYSWEEVSTANWRKYCPWNDKSTHVIAVDTISRHVDPTTGIVSLSTALLYSTSC